jgi:large subunit ribosomal protein L29
MSTKTKKSANQDLSNLSEADLLKNIEDSTLRLKRMMFSHAITPIENPMTIRLVRREIARLQTQLRRKQLGF